ncbi:hypothetical protein E2C01_077094 [Portunus trituberculatus]|uniref:Uncharacterized protein n=1 Tax=Portunus trituberculatus TaxID=210409 RepID=A0A5B7IKU6_PORTR|nr:hypothetical protein [Portunus trituberculatus]
MSVLTAAPSPYQTIKLQGRGGRPSKMVVHKEPLASRSIQAQCVGVCAWVFCRICSHLLPQVGVTVPGQVREKVCFLFLLCPS